MILLIKKLLLMLWDSSSSHLKSDEIASFRKIYLILAWLAAIIDFSPIINESNYLCSGDRSFSFSSFYKQSFRVKLAYLSKRYPNSGHIHCFITNYDSPTMKKAKFLILLMFLLTWSILWRVKNGAYFTFSTFYLSITKVFGPTVVLAKFEKLLLVLVEADDILFFFFYAGSLKGVVKT